MARGADRRAGLVATVDLAPTIRATGAARHRARDRVADGGRGIDGRVGRRIDEGTLERRIGGRRAASAEAARADHRDEDEPHYWQKAASKAAS